MSEFRAEARLPADPTPVDGPEPVTAPDIDNVSPAGERLIREGTPVGLIQSIYVPEDETGFYLLQALSAEAVREASARAGLQFDHISEGVSATPG